MAKDFKLYSFNVNGLGQDSKRLAVFKRLNKLKSIILLQETHSIKNVEIKWKDEWKGDIEYCHGTSSSNGVAILIPPGFDYVLKNTYKDDEGRILIIQIALQDVEYTIVNVYAPTRANRIPQIDFISKLKEMMVQFENETLLIGGDFNLYMSKDLDKLDSMAHSNDNPLYRKEIIEMLDTYDMVDIWRVLNPDSRRYTWHSRGLSSRLDYWFVSDHLLNVTSKVEILPGVFSDHSMLMIEISVKDLERGRGFWKFNSMLLHDVDYVLHIKNLIKLYDEKYNYLEDKGLKWELIKSEIRSFTVPYCVKMKKLRIAYKMELEHKLHNLLPKLDSNNEDAREEFYSTKNELEQIEQKESIGVIIRSKARWVEDGEKNTKFFLGLEKRNSVNKVISQLQVGAILVTDKTEILQAEHDFYQNLYTENLNDTTESYNDAFNSLTDNVHFNKITEEDKDILDQNFNEKEILDSIKSMKNSKSPGSDGLTSEFYKFFWTDIKTLLLESIQYAFQKGELSIEQKRGILTLIPKKDKDRLYLKNWRPITLLNTDYKIIAKVLSTRLQNVLPHIIDEDQTGYIKGRFIGQNIRIIEDILYFVEKEKLPGIILTIDFEKAFDSINWSFIIKSLDLYNFGPQFQKWVKILYTNISSAVINNGNISKWFCPSRGIRQGCPLSAYLFIIGAEILANKIRQDDNIGGIQIGDKFIKISQLADDTTCLLDGLDSLNNILNTFKLFTLCAGLKINLNKTTAKYIGTLKDSDYYPHGLSWIKGNVESLGIVFTPSEDESYLLNFEPRIIKLKNTLQVWTQRQLSLKGKITIINSLALAPLIYVASVIDTPSKVIDEVNKIIIHFFWKSNQPKIAKNVIIQKISDGGLKFPDFECKVKAMRLIWVKRLALNTVSRWKFIPMYYFKCQDLNLFFSCKSGVHCSTSVPEFYKKCHKWWIDVHSVHPQTVEMVKHEILWNNIYITINKKTVFYKEWYRGGIIRIYDILDENNQFMSHTDIASKYGIKCSFLDVLQIRQSIPIQWRTLLYNTRQVGENIHTNCNKIQIVDKLLNFHKLTCKDLYWSLVSKKIRIPTAVKKWSEHFTHFKDADDNIWSHIYQMSFKVTRETRLQSFQYRILHRIVPCNKWLFNISIKESKQCNFCDEEDNILHFFLYCNNSEIFWSSFFNWWCKISEVVLDEILEDQIIFGFPCNTEMELVLNYCVLLGKWYMYSAKMREKNDFDLYGYLVQLKQRLSIEKALCTKENSPQKFVKWEFIFEHL